MFSPDVTKAKVVSTDGSTYDVDFITGKVTSTGKVVSQDQMQALLQLTPSPAAGTAAKPITTPRTTNVNGKGYASLPGILKEKKTIFKRY